jgi:hypothetical protein
MDATMSVYADDVSYPPVLPEGEKVADDNPAFVANCLAKLQAHLTGDKIITKLITESDRWGTILRMDVELPDQDPKNSVKRVICWQRLDGLGVLFSVERPLP